MFVFEVSNEILFPGILFVDAPMIIMCVEVSWIRVQDITEYAYWSVLRMLDRVWWNAVVCRIMFTHVPLEAIACCEKWMMFTEIAPAIMLVGGSF